MKTIIAAILLALSLPGHAHAGAGCRVVAAGASDLSSAFKEMASAFERETGCAVVLSLGSTGMLARQIEQGAPFDAFFAADTRYVEALDRGGFMLPGTVEPYARGRIVVAFRKDSGLRIASLPDLAGPGASRIAIANPAHAPYGAAAMEAMKEAGLWDSLKPRLVYGENIRQALQFIESGNAQAGIVALSIADAPGIGYVEVPLGLYSPLIQAAGVVKRSKEPEAAAAFIRFVNGPMGRAIMKR